MKARGYGPAVEVLVPTGDPGSSQLAICLRAHFWSCCSSRQRPGVGARPHRGSHRWARQTDLPRGSAGATGGSASQPATWSGHRDRLQLVQAQEAA